MAVKRLCDAFEILWHIESCLGVLVEDLVEVSVVLVQSLGWVLLTRVRSDVGLLR
jgi:hypothetical protein